MIKQVQIIPNDINTFITHINQIDTKQEIKDFIISCVYNNNTNINCEMDDFYIDSPYEFNLYNYSQKFNARMKIQLFKEGYSPNKKETNFFTYDDILIKDNKYIRPKSKPTYHDYYKYLEQHFTWFSQKDIFVEIDYPECQNPNEYVFDKKFIEAFIKKIEELFYKGLWINNFNNYSIRYIPEKEKIILFDVDIFYVIKDNEQLKDIKTLDDLFSYMLKYKLNKKEVIYRLKNDTSVDKKLIEYVYYTNWFLENVAEYVGKMKND